SGNRDWTHAKSVTLRFLPIPGVLKGRSRSKNADGALRILLPLDGAGGLGGNVVEHAIDVLDLVADAVADALEHFGRKAEPVGGHCILRSDGPQAAYLFKGALVALDAHATDGQKAHEGLPDCVVEARLADLVDKDGIR